MTSNKINTTNAAELPSAPLFDFATFEELNKLAQDPSYQFPIYDLSTSIPVPVPQNFLTEEEAFEKEKINWKGFISDLRKPLMKLSFNS